MSQSIKEVVQSLVDDGLVQYDKIGSSNCTYAVGQRLREAYIFRIAQSFGTSLRSKVLWWVSICLEESQSSAHRADHPFCGQVQNRLNAAQETQRGLQEQLAELRTAIAAEMADRSESVCRFSSDRFPSIGVLSLLRPNGILLWKSYPVSRKSSRKWRKNFRNTVLAIPSKYKRRRGL